MNVICSSGTDRANGPNLFPIGAVFIPTATPQLSHLGPAEPPITHDLALQVWINTLVSVQGMFVLCRPHICSYFTVQVTIIVLYFLGGKNHFSLYIVDCITFAYAFVCAFAYFVYLCVLLCICAQTYVFVHSFMYLCVHTGRGQNHPYHSVPRWSSAVSRTPHCLQHRLLLFLIH